MRQVLRCRFFRMFCLLSIYVFRAAQSLLLSVVLSLRVVVTLTARVTTASRDIRQRIGVTHRACFCALREGNFSQFPLCLSSGPCQRVLLWNVCVSPHRLPVRLTDKHLCAMKSWMPKQRYNILCICLVRALFSYDFYAPFLKDANKPLTYLLIILVLQAEQFLWWSILSKRSEGFEPQLPKIFDPLLGRGSFTNVGVSTEFVIACIWMHGISIF